MPLAAEIQQRKPFASPEHEAYLNLVRTAAALARHEVEQLRPFDLTSSQYNVLRILRGAGAEGLNCREIGERMLTFDPDVTKLLDRLEARGLVTRERQKHDRRVVVARISPEGLELLARMDQPIHDSLIALLGHLGEKNLKRLSALLVAAREKA